MAQRPLIEKRLEPTESLLTITGLTVLSILLALILGGLLFLTFEISPLEAYQTMPSRALAA